MSLPSIDVYSVRLTVNALHRGQLMVAEAAITPRTIDSAKFDVFRETYRDLCQRLAADKAKWERIAESKETKS